MAAFDGGVLTSNAGALVLREADRAIGLIDRVAACFKDWRRVVHGLRTLVGQRIVGIACGYVVVLRRAGRPAQGLRGAGRKEHAQPAGARPRP